MTSEFIFDGDIAIIPPRMLVQSRLPDEGVAFIDGQSGAGKTFIAMDLAHSLATGEPFFGRAVQERIGVVIKVSEGGKCIVLEARSHSQEFPRLAIEGVKGLLRVKHFAATGGE